MGQARWRLVEYNQMRQPARGRLSGSGGWTKLRGTNEAEIGDRCRACATARAGKSLLGATRAHTGRCYRRASHGVEKKRPSAGLAGHQNTFRKVRLIRD